VKASSKVEVDMDAAEKLLVGRADFLHALEHDVKPAFGSAQEMLESLCTRGIISWGEEVGCLMADAELLLQQAASSDGPGLVSILVEGGPNAGEQGKQIGEMKNLIPKTVCV
jgi:vesicle-fusing ATPase